jgi:hypothetical protein
MCQFKLEGVLCPDSETCGGYIDFFHKRESLGKGFGNSFGRSPKKLWHWFASKFVNIQNTNIVVLGFIKKE